MLAIIQSKIFCPPVSYQKKKKKTKNKIHKTVILQILLHGCETLSLYVGEKHRLRNFENSVQKDILPKTDQDGL
jgi:hypothetical protein